MIKSKDCAKVEHPLSETFVSTNFYPEWNHVDNESLTSEDGILPQLNSLSPNHHNNESHPVIDMGGRLSCGTTHLSYHTSSDACSSSDTDLSFDQSHLGSPNVTNGEINSIQYRLPIVGYEIMEERTRFTVFKIQVEQKATGHNWFVFRRYTDFIRLHKKLKEIFPTTNFSLPPKKWLGDNFNPSFLDERLHGLQKFVQSVLATKDISNCKPVRLFFCLDDPPGAHDTLEESRALCENLEEEVFHLQQQLKDKNSVIEQLKEEVTMLRSQQETLLNALRLEYTLTAYSQSKTTDKNTSRKLKDVRLPPSLYQCAAEIQNLSKVLAEMNHSKSSQIPNDDSNQETKTNGV